MGIGKWLLPFFFLSLSILLSSLYQTSINEMSFHGWLRYKSYSQNTLSSFQGHSWIWGYLKNVSKKTIFLFFSRVFLLRQLRTINDFVKSLSNNLSNENTNTGVSVVFKTKCQNEIFLKYNFSWNTSFYVLCLMIYDYLTINNWCSKKTLLLRICIRKKGFKLGT